VKIGVSFADEALGRAWVLANKQSAFLGGSALRLGRRPIVVDYLYVDLWFMTAMSPSLRYPGRPSQPASAAKSQSAAKRRISGVDDQLLRIVSFYL
jgi:hypothetical protein